MSQKLFARALLGMAFLTLIAIHDAGAQVSTGTISGTVTDSSGAAVPQARVVVKSVETGQERVVVTDTIGNYSIPDLQAGQYSITASHEGFKTTTLPSVELQVAQRATLNPVLQVGSVSEQVTVSTAAAPLLNTQTSSLGQVVDTKTVATMPLNGRNFWQLTQLTPGVSYISTGQNPAGTGGGTSIRASIVNVTINGLDPTWTGWFLDGADITEFQAGGTIIQPNVDALQEFKVEGGNMPAEYGHTPTIVNAALKSGTNAWHGTAYEYFRNSALDAKNYFFLPAAGTHQRDEPLHRNQFGANLGGPIRRDKIFFFVDAESTLLRLGEDFNNVVPSPAERGGDFSGSSTVIINPTTGKPFPGNVIPPSLITPQAQFLLNYMPLPNSVNGQIYRAINTSPLKQQLDKGDIKVDYQMTTADHLMGRYSISDNHETDPNPYAPMGTFPLRSRGQDPEARWTHIFNPSWINEAQMSYYRSYFFFTSSFQGQNINDEAGIQGLDGLAPPEYAGFPGITIANYSNFQGASLNSYPKSNRLRSWQYVDRVTHVFGKHDMRFGFEWFHNKLEYISGSNSVGQFTFNGSYTGDNFADFLLGYAKSGTRSYFRNIWGNIGNFQGYYFQDDYRVRPDLTLNLGFRWEINPFYNGIHGQTTGFDPVTEKLIIPSNFSLQAQPQTATLYPLFEDRIELSGGVGLPISVRPPDDRDIAPRIGFAWNPNGGKWVVRSGYGIFYGYPDDNNINNSQNSVPFIASQTVNNTGTTPPQLTFGNFYQSTPIVSPNPHPGQPCSFGFVANSCSTPNVVSMPAHVRNTYTQQWNLALQHQMGNALSWDVAYVGSKSNRTEQQWSTNDPYPGPGTIQTRRPYPQWGTITLGEFLGAANYNALQAKVEARTWHGATGLVSYTYSKCLDNGTYNISTDVREVNPPLPYYGVCQYNLTNNLVFSYNYALPVGRGKALLSDLPGWGNAFLGNWTVSGITTAQSGLPFTPTISNDQANTGFGNQRPNAVGKPKVLKSVSCWFYISANAACKSLDPGGVNAFAVPALYTYGNLGRYTMRADDLIQFDFAMLKGFNFGNERSIEFRAEFFNIFNRPTFSAPSTTINSASGAQVSSTLNGSRQVEFALKGYF
ncbi:MAG TPA: carboxypeptidase regulatory-like domain-containing protein [Acidobacteriaceae bacterium]|nr:carboxypeptidase regulatory-like domain-containing protein [Acidobacteriaceae bacterium]